MFKNAVYLCAMATPWIKVAKRLESEFNIKSSYFIHWQMDKDEFISSGLKNCHLQTIEDAWKMQGFPKNIQRHFFDEEELKKIAHYELIALKMMDRLDPDDESFPFNSRLSFFRDLLGYWFNVVEDRDIDLVISSPVPHCVFDYALFVICKIKKIKFITFQRILLFGNYNILIDDIDNMPKLNLQLFNGNLPSEIIQAKINNVLQDYNQAKPFYMIVQEKINARLTYFKLLQNFLRKIPKLYYLFKSPNTYWVQKGRLPNESKYSWLELFFTKYKRALKVRSFKKHYDAIVTDNLPEKFVLVALNYQPEETSCPSGGVYADQILMLQLLNQHLPKNINIIVKEHKTQFYLSTESASGRNQNFYRQISKIDKRVKFVSENYNPFVLIDKAKAVVTIGGTIGWESAIRGTPTLIFGRAWYENMPRVLKVKTKEDLAKALLQVEELKNKDLHSEILGFHAALEDKVIKSYQYRISIPFVPSTDVTTEESIDNLVKGISKNLSLKNKA